MDIVWDDSSSDSEKSSKLESKSDTYFECRFCQKTYRSKYWYEKHLKNHN